MIGQTLSHYRITAALGAGGMGEVYRATDTKLGRDVAIKVLPPEVAGDPERLARFEREAQLLAALNHPNIGAIYGLEEAGEKPFLVLELVEGEDLQQRLDRGAIPVDEAIEIAWQIAEGLETAHYKGVVHRDLKPANVKLTPDGKVKVLDFGLAKAWAGDPVSGSSSDLSQSPTLAHAGTQAGVILGTAAYMSPEQARGKAVDQRTDVWALGAVLWEMLMGRQLFAGDTVSDIVAAVLTREPDWAALPAGTPASVHRLLRRTLERNPRRRLQAIGEARLVLEDPAAASVDAATPPRKRPRYRSVVAAVAGGVALFAAGWLLRPTPPGADPTVRKLDLSVADLAVRNDVRPAISPDGSRIAYAAANSLWVRELERFEATELPDTDGARYFFWSPDSRHLAYTRQGRAWKVPVDGGQPTELGVVPDDLVGSGDGVWTRDGRILLAGSDTVGLWEVPAEGGEGREILELDREREVDLHELGMLPEDRGIVFTVHGPAGYSIGLLAEGSRRELLVAPTGEVFRFPVYSPSGHLVYARTTTNPGIWAIPFSLESLETTGAPFLVVAGGSSPTVARDGTLCFTRPAESPVELVRVARSGGVEVIGALPDLADPTGSVRLSPDGTRVVIGQGYTPGLIWVYDLRRGAISTLTRNAIPTAISWTPSGDRVVYASARDARSWNLWTGRVDAAGEERRLSTSVESQWPQAVSPDGRWLIFTDGASGRRLLRLPLDGSGEATPLFPSQATAFGGASFSPDGRWLAYSANEPGRMEIYVRPFPDGEKRWQVSTDGGERPIWGRNGEIFYRSDGRLHGATVTTRGDSITFSKPTPLFAATSGTTLGPDYDVTADGQTFLMLRSSGQNRISLVFNWPVELARLEAENATEAR